MKRTRMPSRLLNDQRSLFGLCMSDFAGAIGIFVGLSLFLEGTRFETLALPISVFVLVPISPIRLTTRRKIIRDWFRYFLTPRSLYDPKKMLSS